MGVAASGPPPFGERVIACKWPGLPRRKGSRDAIDNIVLSKLSRGLDPQNFLPVFLLLVILLQINIALLGL